MVNKCPITKKTSSVGGGYSNRIRATKFNPTGKNRKKLNIQKKKVFIESTGKKVNIKISTRGLKKLKKDGAYKVLKTSKII